MCPVLTTVDTKFCKSGVELSQSIRALKKIQVIFFLSDNQPLKKKSKKNIIKSGFCIKKNCIFAIRLKKMRKTKKEVEFERLGFTYRKRRKS